MNNALSENKIVEMTINLKKLTNNVSWRYKAPHGVRNIKRLIQKTFNTKEDVLIAPDLNKALWVRGMKNIPGKVRVRVERGPCTKNPAINVFRVALFMWIRKKSEKHDKHYYFNTKTNESVWDRPKSDFHIYHILIKHNKSRKPVSISEEEALNECNALLTEIKKSDKPVECFKKIALQRSDCSSSKRSGDLGYILADEMYKEFEEAAFKLCVGEIDGPVVTKSGFHIIYRE